MADLRKRFWMSHGLPFKREYAKNLDAWKHRTNKRNKASLIIIDGGVGEGKTTLAVHTADYLNGAYELLPDGNYRRIDEKMISFKNQLAMGGLHFLKTLKTCFKEGIGVVVYDEAGDFNRRGFLSRFNAMLNRVFETYRAFKIIVVVCLPSFHVLDSDLLDKKISRGLFHCYKRSEFEGNFKGYSLFRMYYIQDKMKKLVVKPFAYNIVEPNIHGNFLDLPPERSKALDHFSSEGKLDIMEIADIKMEGFLSMSDMSFKLAKSLSWVKKQMAKLKIREVRIYKKVKYFKPETLDILMNVEGKEKDSKKIIKEDKNYNPPEE